MNVLMLLRPKSKVEYLFENCTLRQALEKMKIHGYTAIPVLTKDGLYAGCVSEGDFLRYIIENTDTSNLIKELECHRIREIMDPARISAVTVNVDMGQIIERSKNQNFIPVTDDRGYFIGIVTRRSIIDVFCSVDNITDSPTPKRA